MDLPVSFATYIMNKQQLRKAGRFIKVKLVEKQIKAAACRTLQAVQTVANIPAKTATSTADVTENGSSTHAPSGRRIVDVNLLRKSMYCEKCQRGLCFRDIESEKLQGVSSIWSVRCPSCMTNKFIRTSNEYVNKKTKRRHHVINIKVAAAAIDAGVGRDQINTIFSALNMPQISCNTFKRSESQIGPSIDKVAKKSCEDALIEERELTLKDPLPSQGISPDTENSKDATVGIAVSFDMGYGTRGTGRTYDSNTGHASAYGHKSKKLVGFATKMRKCFQCERGHSKDLHDCQGIYNGTAKSMESAAAVDLLTSQNTSLAKANVRVDVFIGDGDSSSISQVRAKSDHKVTKWLDINHTVKSLNNFLFQVKSKHKFDNTVIDYLKKCFSYALSQNRHDEEATKAAIRNIVDHAFGSHDACGTWCKYLENPTTYKHIGLPGGNDLIGDQLRKDLTATFERFAQNAASLAPGGSSQANESFNNTVVSKAPKSRFYGGTSSHHYRVAAAAAQTNLGTQYIYKSFQELGMSPGGTAERLRKRKDYWRSRRILLKKSVAYKKRRLHLKFIKRQKRLGQNQKECLSYMPDVAFLQTVSTVTSQPQVQCRPKSNDSLIVYVDIETTGFAKNSEIVQLAAKCMGSNGSTFSMYAYPLRSIPSRVKEITGLEMNGGQLLLRNVPVPATTLNCVMNKFVQFLEGLQKSIILVGHNSFSFDFPRLYRELCNFNLLQEFCNIVSGLADTLQLFKSNSEISKNELSLKQTDLAEKYIPNWNLDEAHEALSDCLALEKICDALKYSDKFVSLCTSTNDFVKKQICKENRVSTEPQLKDLKGIVSNAIIKRLAENSISTTSLRDIYNNGQEESVRVLLADDNGQGKPRITNNKKIIRKLTDYLKTQVMIEENVTPVMG